MIGGLSLLREIIDSCAGAERKAAEHILAEPRTAVFCTVAELARRAGTSPPAVVRLCKRAGLSGFRELQLRIGGPRDANTPPPLPTWLSLALVALLVSQILTWFALGALLLRR